VSHTGLFRDRTEGQTGRCTESWHADSTSYSHQEADGFIKAISWQVGKHKSKEESNHRLSVITHLNVLMQLERCADSWWLFSQRVLQCTSHPIFREGGSTSPPPHSLFTSMQSHLFLPVTHSLVYFSQTALPKQSHTSKLETWWITNALDTKIRRLHLRTELCMI